MFGQARYFLSDYKYTYYAALGMQAHAPLIGNAVGIVHTLVQILLNFPF